MSDPVVQIEMQIDKVISQMENVVEKLEQALNEILPVSKNTLIEEAIKILKG